ncbi:hypothetical protein [Streptomyces sp.]|uniref:hypothetical protein n=1 Tax=Streptomyces sp. TaxID=1931 RepID=UPI002F93E861
MSDDLRQRYAEALAAAFTEPVYRCDRDGENERVEKADPADRIDQTPYVMITAGDGCRSFWTPSCAELAEVVAAVRDEEMEQLRYERRLLGAARMVLDLVAAGDSSRWDQVRQGAEDVAQRIVDEIGHPVTDEPALGPGYRAVIARVRDLHQPTEGMGSNCDEDDTPGSYGRIAQVCTSCGTPGEQGVRWPCPTIAALGDQKAEHG